MEFVFSEDKSRIQCIIRSGVDVIGTVMGKFGGPLDTVQFVVDRTVNCAADAVRIGTRLQTLASIAALLEEDEFSQDEDCFYLTVPLTSIQQMMAGSEKGESNA